MKVTQLLTCDQCAIACPHLLFHVAFAVGLVAENRPVYDSIAHKMLIR